MLMQSNLRILKLRAQNAQKSRNEGIGAAWLAGSSGCVPLCFPRCIPTDAQCTLLAAAPGLPATPSHRAVPLGSQPGGGTAPVKDGACSQVVKECQCCGAIQFV